MHSQFKEIIKTFPESIDSSLEKPEIQQEIQNLINNNDTETIVFLKNYFITKESDHFFINFIKNLFLSNIYKFQDFNFRVSLDFYERKNFIIKIEEVPLPNGLVNLNNSIFIENIQYDQSFFRYLQFLYHFTYFYRQKLKSEKLFEEIDRTILFTKNLIFYFTLNENNSSNQNINFLIKKAKNLIFKIIYSLIYQDLHYIYEENNLINFICNDKDLLKLILKKYPEFFNSKEFIFKTIEIANNTNNQDEINYFIEILNIVLERVNFTENENDRNKFYLSQELKKSFLSFIKKHILKSNSKIFNLKLICKIIINKDDFKYFTLDEQLILGSICKIPILSDQIIYEYLMNKYENIDNLVNCFKNEQILNETYPNLNENLSESELNRLFRNNFITNTNNLIEFSNSENNLIESLKEQLQSTRDLFYKYAISNNLFSFPFLFKSNSDREYSKLKSEYFKIPFVEIIGPDETSIFLTRTVIYHYSLNEMNKLNKESNFLDSLIKNIKSFLLNTVTEPENIKIFFYLFDILCLLNENIFCQEIVKIIFKENITELLSLGEYFLLYSFNNDMLYQDIGMNISDNELNQIIKFLTGRKFNYFTKFVFLIPYFQGKISYKMISNKNIQINDDKNDFLSNYSILITEPINIELKKEEMLLFLSSGYLKNEFDKQMISDFEFLIKKFKFKSSSRIMNIVIKRLVENNKFEIVEYLKNFCVRPFYGMDLNDEWPLFLLKRYGMLIYDY